MVWLRIDDQIAHHPKFIDAGPIASWLWVCGNAYCNKYLTDGFIRSSALGTLGGVTNAKRWAEVLVKVGLWEAAAGGYRVHDFHDFNPTAQEVRANREWDRRRKELYSDPALIAAIRKRDQDHCRYCGCRVSWKDRRGPIGGQYDHVIPRGDNSLENVVTACRGCNNKKGGRTPEEAGMRVLRPKSELVPT